MAGFGSKGGHRPHRRRATRRGSSSGMKGYSRYASLGQGLSDQAQHAYNTLARSKLTSGVDRAIFDRAVMTFRLKEGGDMLRGLYNIPGAPNYAGGEVNYASLTQAQQTQVMRALKVNKPDGGQYGAITTGRGGGMPKWMAEMMQRVNAEEAGKSGSTVLPMGLALVALKVLL